MKKYLKQISALTLAFALLAGCTPKTQEQPTDDTQVQTSENNPQRDVKDMKIGFSVPQSGTEYYDILTLGVKEEAEKAGVSITINENNGSISEQKKDIEKLVSDGANTIVLVPNGDEISEIVPSLKEKQIVVVAIDSLVQGADCSVFVESVAAVNLVVEKLEKSFPANSKIAQIAGTTGISSTTEKTENFTAGTKDKFNLVATENSNFTKDGGKKAMSKILKSNPDIVAVFAHNDEMALGAYEAISESGKDIKVIGFDGIQTALDSIAKGELFATVKQPIKPIGGKAVEMGISVFQGGVIPDTITAKTTLVDKENPPKSE